MIEFLQEWHATLSRLEDWLRAHEDLTRGATLVLLAWALAAWFQGRSMRWQFRAHTLREVSLSYNRLLLAAFKINAVVATGGDSAPPTTSKVPGDMTILVAPKPTDYRLDFIDSRHEFDAMKPIVELHFRRRDVLNHYQGILDQLLEVADPDRPAEAISADIEKAQSEWSKFLLCAGIEVGVNTWWRRLRRNLRAK